MKITIWSLLSVEQGQCLRIDGKGIGNRTISPVLA